MNKIDLINHGKNNYELDSKIINQVLEFVLNMNKKELFIVSEINNEAYEKIIQIFEKLSTGYPLAYITNQVNFAGYDFYVDKNVLLPRDDTEVLINAVIDTKLKHSTNLIDIGTGSGIIPISILKSDKVDVEKSIALELSEKAFMVAEKNIKGHNLQEKISLINIDFRQFDFGQFEGKDLIITANLPYIKEADFTNMDFGVYTFEPNLALYGGKETGFELYENLIILLIKIKDKFTSLDLFIEIGFDQYEVSKDFLFGKGLKFEYFKDTNNIYRVIKINF